MKLEELENTLAKRNVVETLKEVIRDCNLLIGKNPHTVGKVKNMLAKYLQNFKGIEESWSHSKYPSSVTFEEFSNLDKTRYDGIIERINLGIDKLDIKI